MFVVSSFHVPFKVEHLCCRVRSWLQSLLELYVAGLIRDLDFHLLLYKDREVNCGGGEWGGLLLSRLGRLVA